MPGQNKFYNDIQLKECLINTFKNNGFSIIIKKEIDTDNGDINYIYKIGNKNKSRLFVININYEISDNVLNLNSAIKYVPMEHKFSIPILSMCICHSLTLHNTQIYKLSAVLNHAGKEYCLLCHYQKYRFQPIGKNCTLGQQLEMTADISILSNNIYNELKGHKLCFK